MAERRESRRDYLTLQALDPATGTLTARVQISYGRMQAVGRRSLGHAKECGYIVPTILQGPTAVFEGLRREEDEDVRGVGWRCYCGVPNHSNWRWEKADSEQPILPVDHQTRFKKRLLWP
jgi:hypothetical protein